SYTLDTQPTNAAVSTLQRATLAGALLDPITHANVAKVTLQTGTKADTIDVKKTPAGVSTTVKAGGGGDVVTGGASGLTLDGIQGELTLDGQGGANRLNFQDRNSARDVTWTLDASATSATSAALKRTAAATTNYVGFSAVWVYAGSKVDTFNVGRTLAGS